MRSCMNKKGNVIIKFLKNNNKPTKIKNKGACMILNDGNSVIIWACFFHNNEAFTVELFAIK